MELYAGGFEYQVATLRGRNTNRISTTWTASQSSPHLMDQTEQ